MTTAGALCATGGLVGLTAQTAFAGGPPSPIEISPAGPTKISPGHNNQAAAPFIVRLPAGNFSAGDTIRIEVQPSNASYGATPFLVVPAHANESASNDFVGFAALPTVTVTPASSNSGADTVPTVTPSLSYDPSDGAGSTTVIAGDILTLTLSNSGAVAGNDYFNITVGGVSYNVGSASLPGYPATKATYTLAGGTPTPVQISSAPDALITTFTVTTATPPVGIQPNTSISGSAVPNVVVSESVGGAIASTSLTLTAPQGFTFLTAPAVSLTGGGSIGTGTLTTPNTATYSYTPSTAASGAATFTFSNIVFVDTGALAGHMVMVFGGSSPTTGGVAVTVGAVTPNSRTAGAGADDTAAALFESGATGSTINHLLVPGQTIDSSGVANAVLATDAGYTDALAANYLAGGLTPPAGGPTGILLTSPDSLPQSTLTALRLENVQTVYVVGGPLAVSAGVISQLENTQAYYRGNPEVNANGDNVYLKVVRIGGQSLYDTAYDIATYLGTLTGSLPGISNAYGSSTLNDTTGMQSATAPSNAVTQTTAILATGNGFQDAMSASPISWYEHVPIILTDGTAATLSQQAQAAITNLGINQILVVGGPLAVPDSVVAQLQAEGVSVVRIAGMDYTDTSAKIANYINGINYANNPQPSGVVPGVVNLVRGDYWSDGLAGGPVAGAGVGFPSATNSFSAPGVSEIEPILLTEGPGNLGSYTAAYLALQAAGGIPPGNGINISYSLNVFGGPLAVTPADLQNADNAIAAGA